MSQERQHYTALMAFSSSAAQVWKLLNNFGNKQLYSNNMHANLAPDEAGGWSGTFTIGSARFRAVYRPYDIRLTSQDIKIGLSLQPQREGCIAMAVATHGENAPFIVTDYELLQFLSSLKSCAGEIIRDADLLVADNKRSAEVLAQKRAAAQQTPSVKTSSPVKTAASSASSVRTSSSAPRSEEQAPKKVFSARAAEAAERHGKTAAKKASAEEVSGLYREQREKKTKVRKNRNIGKKLILALMALVAVVAVVWGVKTVRKLFPGSGPESEAVNEGGSRGVTVSNGLNLSLGITQSQIERTFGKPVSQSNGVCRYESSSLTSYGMPSCVIQVEYSGQLADKVTILDLEEASKVGAIQNMAPSFNAETSLSELVEQVGTVPSMVRLYSQDAVQVTEYHFGHVDPKANLSPVWKGELICTQRSDGSYQTSYGFSFDGQDPLFVSSLEGTPLAAVYSSFDDYLADYYEFRKCLLTQNHYSRGDMQQIIPGMERVSTGETEIYRANSACLLEDGVTPAWNYTIGIGARGTFMYFFGVNTRNWKKADLLKDVDLKSIDVGMNWNDLLASVGQIPNMVYVDYSYITVGFGAYREDAQYLSEQFELMAVVDLNTWTVETVYDNTERTIVIE